MEIISCPECGAPADVVPHGSLRSTHGAVDHVRVWCIDRHWFLMPRDVLPVTPVALAAER
jgi:hypothetical protein